MEKRVLISPWQKVSEGDFNEFGEFPRDSLDHVVFDTIIPDRAFSGFIVTATAAAEVTVSAGRLFDTGKVYFNDNEGGFVISLLQQLPVVANRIVAIVAWGVEQNTKVEPRTFLTDAATRATVAQETSTEVWRWANLASSAGVEAPDPQRPAVAANMLVVAWVTLSPTGIVSIERAVENVVPSVRSLDNARRENDIWRRSAGARLDTLGTDLAALATRLLGTAAMSLVLRVMADVARVREKLKLPSTYSDYSVDHFLTEDLSDLGHVDYLAKVEEGIRFPDAGSHSAQIGLLNPFNPDVVTQSFFMLPKYDEVVRIADYFGEGEIQISQYQYQTTTWRLMNKTRARIRFGTPFYVCSNGVWWYAPYSGAWVTTMQDAQYGGGFTPNVDLIFDPIKQIFTRPGTGETFQLLDVQDPAGHSVLRLVQFWVDEVIDYQYWDRVVTTEGLNGSIISQTFLNSQGGWLTGVDIPFSRVGTAGDVYLLITETANGAPDFTRAIAMKMVPAASLSAPAWVPFNFQPTYLARGKRYAMVLLTAGNHYVYTSANNRYTQGSLFISTDGEWQQGDTTRDVCFQMRFAQFQQVRVEIPLLPLELTAGIAAIDLNYDSIRPPGSLIEWQIQVNGTWTPLQAYDVQPLNGLPAMLPFRVVFTGTKDEMPGIGVASNSRVFTFRPRSDFRHISKARLPAGGNIHTVHVDERLEGWRGAPYHTHVVRLLTGASYATVTNAAVITDSIPPDDPSALVRRHTFTFGAAITGYKIRTEGLTDNVVATYHVAERLDISLV